jgi:hypothetical protein
VSDRAAGGTTILSASFSHPTTQPTGGTSIQSNAVLRDPHALPTP